jgi:hypothetical protein
MQRRVREGRTLSAVMVLWTGVRRKEDKALFLFPSRREGGGSAAQRLERPCGGEGGEGGGEGFSQEDKKTSHLRVCQISQGARVAGEGVFLFPQGRGV